MFDALREIFFGTGPIEAVQAWFGTGVPGPFELLSLLGDTWGVILVVGVAMWICGRRTTYALLALIALGAVTKELMSRIFSVPRPQGPEIEVYKKLTVTSFPSGHVYQIVAPWTLLYARDCVPLLIPVGVALAVSISRLYLGVHYLGDVVFAVVLAILLVWGFLYFWPRVAPWFADRALTFYVWMGLAGIGGVVMSMVLRLNNPRRWEILGMIVGAAVGFILEHRYVSYRPAGGSWKKHMAKLALGIAGIAVCLIADRLFPAAARVPGLFTASGAVLWAVLGAPILFKRLKW